MVFIRSVPKILLSHLTIKHMHGTRGPDTIWNQKSCSYEISKSTFDFQLISVISNL